MELSRVLVTAMASALACSMAAPAAGQTQDLAKWLKDLKAKDAGVRQHAWVSISTCGVECRSAAPALAEIYQTGTAVEREAVVDALTGIVNAIGVRYAMDAQASKKALVRVAEESECRLIAPLLAPTVRKAPADADPAWMGVSELLARCGTAKEVPLFVDLLKASDVMVRFSAAEGLGRIGTAAQAAIPALQALIDKAAPGGIRDRYQQALDKIRGKP